MMKEYKFNEIHGENSFFINGLSALIDMISQHDFPTGGRYETDVLKLPDIWVFSRDSVDELSPFVRQIVPHRPVIVFGKGYHKRLLNGVPGLEQMVFLNLNISPDRAEKRIKMLFSAYHNGMPINSVSFISYPSLTSLERYVLTGVMSGISISEFASHTGKSVKSISACKRRIMKKLNVFNNQELFVRAWAMGIHFDAQ